MSRKPQDVTDAELAILQFLWDHGQSTVREITEELYPAGTSSDMATVQKLLKRLEAKDCVSLDRSVWPRVYQATTDRAELIGRRLQTTADELCDGALTPLLTHFVKGRRLSRKDRAALRNLLDELEA